MDSQGILENGKQTNKNSILYLKLSFIISFKFIIWIHLFFNQFF